MVRIGFAAALAASMPFPASAQPQTWRQGSSSGGQAAFIDTASIERAGDKVRFWREVRTAQPALFESGERYDRIGSLLEVDCRARTLRNLRIYAKLGDTLIFESGEASELEAVEAGTTADTDLRAACFNEWPG